MQREAGVQIGKALLAYRWAERDRNLRRACAGWMVVCVCYRCAWADLLMTSVRHASFATRGMGWLLSAAEEEWMEGLEEGGRSKARGTTAKLGGKVGPSLKPSEDHLLSAPDVGSKINHTFHPSRMPAATFSIFCFQRKLNERDAAFLATI